MKPPTRNSEFTKKRGKKVAVSPSRPLICSVCFLFTAPFIFTQLSKKRKSFISRPLFSFKFPNNENCSIRAVSLRPTRLHRTLFHLQNCLSQRRTSAGKRVVGTQLSGNQIFVRGEKPACGQNLFPPSKNSRVIFQRAAKI